MAVSVDLTADMEAANRSRFHLRSDECHSGHLNCDFTVRHHLHSHYDRLLRKRFQVVKHDLLLLTADFVGFGMSEIVPQTLTLAPQDLNYLQSMILKLNRVDFWSCAHPN